MSVYGIRKYVREIQNSLSSYSDLENLIREATNTDTWGPTSEQKKRILNVVMAHSSSAQDPDSLEDFEDAYGGSDVIYTHRVSQYVVEFIVKRIKEYGKMTPKSQDSLFEVLKRNLVTKGYAFLIVSKCLQLLEYMLINGFRTRANTITFDIRDDLLDSIPTIEKLLNYRVKVAYDGLNLQHETQIRDATKRLLNLINNKEALSRERVKYYPKAERALGTSYVAEGTERPLAGRDGASAIAAAEAAEAPGASNTTTSSSTSAQAAPPLVDLLDFDEPESTSTASATVSKSPIPQEPIETNLDADNPWNDEFGEMTTAQTQKKKPASDDLFSDILSGFK